MKKGDKKKEMIQDYLETSVAAPSQTVGARVSDNMRLDLDSILGILQESAPDRKVTYSDALKCCIACTAATYREEIARFRKKPEGPACS